MSFAAEEEFLALVGQDVKEFLECDPENHDRVLVFMAFNKRLRYLIHQLVSEDFEGLVTKSFGSEGKRFTCICYADRCGSDENCDQFASPTSIETQRHFPLSSSSYLEEPSNHSRGVSPASSTRSSTAGGSGSSPRRRGKRPDKEVYIPKARLAHHHHHRSDKKLSSRNNKRDLSADLEALSLKDDDDDEGSPSSRRTTTTTTSPTRTSEVLNAAKIALGERRYLNGEIYCGDDYLTTSSSSGGETPNGGSSKVSSPKNSPALSDEEEEEGSPRPFLSPTPDSNVDDLVEALKEAFGGGALEICRAKGDYNAYKPARLDSSAYGHVLELYDFPKAVRERDLFRAFVKYRDGGGFEVKWVNDTSALGVFCSPAAAEEALQEGSHICTMRPLSEGSEEALIKANRIRYALTPALKRPATNFSFARRMIGHALGQRLQVSQEKTEAERQQLQDAKERKKTSRRSNQATPAS